jgi:protein tyrosine/serine phosphatase
LPLLDKTHALAQLDSSCKGSGLDWSEMCVGAFQTISGTVETGSPTMFFCKVGKDRTGLVAALILAACGASDAEIVSDYARYFP